MHEYELLEKKWQKYHYKRVFIKIVIVGAAISLLLGFMWIWKNKNQEVGNTTLQHTSNYLTPSLEFEKHLSKKAIKQSKKEIKIKKSSKKENEKPKNTHITINATKLTLQQMLQKFHKQPSLDLANLIAKEYFLQKNYQKAMQWAIKANEFDKSDDESWIIFAKSAYKLGQKQKAINALKIYLHKYPSKKVKELLIQMVQKGSL